MNNKKKFKNSYKLFEKSKRFIPLAAQTFSKSSMNFVFGASPYLLVGVKEHLPGILIITNL